MARDQLNNLDPLDGRMEDEAEDIAVERTLTTTADVESAGRSCMAILVLGVIIVIVLCAWIGLRTIGVGR